MGTIEYASFNLAVLRILMFLTSYPFPEQTAIHYLSGHRVFAVPEAAMLLIGLVLNVFLAALFGCMSFIQSTTLRWALCRAARLKYNSKPRLLIGARNFAPNRRSTNVVSAIALVMGFGSISALTASVYLVGLSDGHERLVEGVPVPGPRFAIDFNGWSFIGLGIALLLQGVISSWCLLKSKKLVPTWSSNPFTRTLLCSMLGVADQSVSKIDGIPHADALVSVNDIPKRVDTKSTWLTASESGQGIIVSRPQSRQPSMATKVPHSRRAMYMVWSVSALILLWIVFVAVFGANAGNCSKAYVEQMNYRTDFLSYWQSCQVGIPYYVDPFLDRRDWLGLIIQCLVFAVISLSIHCLELTTDIARDEAAWRKLPRQVQMQDVVPYSKAQQAYSAGLRLHSRASHHGSSA